MLCFRTTFRKAVDFTSIGASVVGADDNVLLPVATSLPTGPSGMSPVCLLRRRATSMSVGLRGFSEADDKNVLGNKNNSMKYNVWTTLD